MQPQLVTPDGTGLLVGSFQDGDDLRLVRVDRETGEETVVAAVAGHDLDTTGTMMPGVLPPTVFTSRRTGDAVAARFVGDRPRIEVLDPHFAEVHAALEKLSDGVLGTLSSDESERRWVATFVHDRDPGVTWFYDHGTGESRLLFRSYPRLDPADLAPMTAVGFPAGDGCRCARSSRSRSASSRVACRWCCSSTAGPGCTTPWATTRRRSSWPTAATPSCRSNFRGSLGHGRRHVTAAIGEFAGRMHDDLVDAVDQAVAQGYADPDDPAQEADMMARSPITMADRIRTPLLVAQGANDVRVVQAESDNIVASLRDRGVPVEYLVADDEGHGFDNPENRIRLYRAIERHFAEHLGGRQGPER
ncbi:MAG TPA: prolyl oligopeptidase family serine peptidase [Pseudonocardia sp.]|nr:prolyl oligopeptidase family serine peptidase [Pseudonocardia sp.]